VRAVVVDRDFSRKETDELTEKVKLQGGKGLAVIKIVDGKLESSLLKFFSDDLQKQIVEAVKATGYVVKGTQTIFAIADVKAVANKVCGWLRSEMGTLMNMKDPKTLAYAWVVDFPMFEWNADEKKWDFSHNPFSMPQGGLKSLKELKPDQIMANQYDLVCNGYEMASGSIRNHHPETFIEAFKITGYDEAETRAKFGHMISAFEFGAPPHGGFAPGLDRMLMVLFDETNIREVYAFPQTNGQELMMNSPREVPKSDLDKLGLAVKDKGAEVRSKVLAALDKCGAKYQLIEHEEARTSEDAAKFRGTQLSEGAKAIVLHSLDYPSKFIQVVVPADRQVDLKKVEAVLGEKLEVGKTEDVEGFTGLKVGAIPPFGRLMGMEVYFDGAFWAKNRVAFNVGSRDKSIIMQAKDLVVAAEPNKMSKEWDFTV
jgi:prolyl-tRNA editing enzyme YbaK/EbsC (Cys-tRNA(Pro) deacylase)